MRRRPADVAPTPPPVDPEDAFSVLADPTRWLLVRALPARGEVSYAALRQALDLTKPSLTYHTRILARAGLIDVHKRGRRVSCSLRRDALRGLVGQLAYLAALPPPSDREGSSVRPRPPRRVPEPPADAVRTPES